MTWPRLRPAGRRFFAPEVIQTSSMDCGPASLKCLLEGFGISISYPRLQEACQTDIDGTSINAIEQVAIQLGLDAQQVMIPLDHVFCPAAGALPGLLVTRRANMLHFLVAWRRHGRLIQVMDPAVGRRWLSQSDVVDELYTHLHVVPARAWREWAASPEFQDPLTMRLRSLGLTNDCCARVLATAAGDPRWIGIAALDAATRMVSTLVRSAAIGRGEDAGRLLQALFDRALDTGSQIRHVIPPVYWSVEDDSSHPDGSQIKFRGAVLVRVRNRAPTARAVGKPSSHDHRMPLSRDLFAALREPPLQPLRHALRCLFADGVLAPAVIAWAVLLGAGTVLIELLIIRSFLDIGSLLVVPQQRLGAITIVVLFMILVLSLELTVGGGVLRMGRRAETRLRLALLEKLPRLGDRYFQSRLVSDMAQRAHGLPMLRALPGLGAQLIRSSAQLLLTVIGLAWLHPSSAPLAVVAAALAFATPFATQRMLAERELRKRVHSAAMSGFYLDSLLGLVPARTHGAERALRRSHEARVVEWGRAGLHLLRCGLIVDGIQSLAGLCITAWLILGYIVGGGSPGGALLFIYWAMSVSGLGRDLAGTLQQYPAYRNTLARLLEPLGAPNETARQEPIAPVITGHNEPSGMSVAFGRVNIRAAGREILRDINLTIQPGEHIAVVGRSGAGKSSLVGALLGWNRPSAGSILVDGVVLNADTLANLRCQTAWIDPAVQLWNRSLIDNIRYGSVKGSTPHLAQIIETAEIAELLECLPDGLQSLLGEGGALASGGEGQRVRFGRALARQNARLVIMDEPFRGLDRELRHELLKRARDCWCEATLVCVTHDISETQSFNRVLVLDQGEIVEDGNPCELAKRAGGIYAQLIDAERDVAQLWSRRGWRRLRLVDGELIEDARQEVTRWTVHQGSRGL